MKNNLPLVTVITPVYNRADLVEETIRSVLSQDYPNIEYILLDDGSKDNSWAVLQKYKNQTILERHENMGETGTVNKGFSLAKGEIIGVLSSDDLLLPGAISKMVQCLVDNPEIIVAYPDYRIINEKSAVIGHITTLKYSYAEMLKYFNCLPGVGAFFRAQVLQKLQGRDPHFKYVADFDFWLRAGLLGQFMRVPETLAAFRVFSGSTSVNSKGSLMAQEHIDLAKKTYLLPAFPQEFQKLKKETLSSANFIAWYVSGKTFFSREFHYLSASFLYSPAKTLFIVKYHVMKRLKKIKNN
jgi:glycosyltransferase involved in cell wall biosynthesis